MTQQQPTSVLVYVGSFQPQFRNSLTVDVDIAGKGDGIYTYTWDEERGELALIRNTYAITNPARLCYDAENARVYVASDTNEFLNWEAGTGGGLYAFAMEKEGALKYVDSRSSCGVRAVDIRCDATGKYVLCINEGTDFCTTEFLKNQEGRYVANIRRDEGCVTLLRVGPTGFEKVCDRYVLPEGMPAHPIRLHLDKDNYVYTLNRSGNTITILHLNTTRERLVPVATVPLPGSPKGLAFHPTLPQFFVSCPQQGEILLYHFDESRQHTSLVQKTFEEEESYPGLLLISKDGQTLYAADTRLGQIKVYGISQEGKPVLLQRLTEGIPNTGPDTLYDMQWTPSGKWLLLTDVHGGALLACPVGADGRLGQVQTFATPTPTGLLIVG